MEHAQKTSVSMPQPMALALRWLLVSSAGICGKIWVDYLEEIGKHGFDINEQFRSFVWRTIR